MTDAEATVVVAAYNEEHSIARVLVTLTEAARTIPLRAIVVCNGCTDATESICRSFEGVEVLALARASKAAALNAGDVAAGAAFPRLYVDGDIETDAESIVALLAALRVEQVRAVGPCFRYTFSGTPWLVRSWFRTTLRLPFYAHWQAHHLQGRGIYGTNRAGRARFDDFPDIRSDDGFFDVQYCDGEREIVQRAIVRLPCPTSTAAFLRNQTRVTAGFLELDEWITTHGAPGALHFTGEDGKGWRDRRLWLASPLVKEFFRRPTALDFVGFVIVDALSRTNRILRHVLRRPIRWR